MFRPCLFKVCFHTTQRNAVWDWDPFVKSCFIDSKHPRNQVILRPACSHTKHSQKTNSLGCCSYKFGAQVPQDLSSGGILSMEYLIQEYGISHVSLLFCAILKTVSFGFIAIMPNWVLANLILTVVGLWRFAFYDVIFNRFFHVIKSWFQAQS